MISILMTTVYNIYIDKLRLNMIEYSKMTTNNDTINIQSLVSIGLSKNEASAYLACLSRGEVTIMELVRLTGIRRTTLYGVTEDLEKKGLITFLMKHAHRIYCAEDPKKLKSFILKQKNEIEHKAQNLESFFPNLNMLYSAAGSKPVVSFYQGQEEVRNIFEDVLLSGTKEFLFICEIGVIENVLGEQYLKDYVKRRVKAGLWTRGIYAPTNLPNEGIYKSGKENLRTVRIGPEGLKSLVYTGIYENKVYFVSSIHEAYGVVIESKDLYESMKTWFEGLWSISKEPAC